MTWPRARSLAFLLVAPWVSTCSLQSLDSLQDRACPDGLKVCQVEDVPACVRRDQPLYGCKADTCAACAFDNATPRCGSTGMCEIASCTLPWADCNHMAGDGCEVNTNSDPTGCGQVCEVCAFANATPLCEEGHCRMGPCKAGFRDCNQLVDDGCEVNVLSDAQHCGECAVTCAPGQTCNLASCI